MPFWAYMLHCADRTFYVGHTDDLERRVALHASGELRGYTSTRLPVKLVWCQEFPSRHEALQAEQQVKGWIRAKKLALIRGDWELISALACNREGREGFDRLSPNGDRRDAMHLNSERQRNGFTGAPRRCSGALPAQTCAAQKEDDHATHRT